ncbi:uncharacterized protein LOC142635577 [Castanea sativa]|uniref:uncharacterized protein LOC142635577 n=1 Tax=Castanea sativa TaxID=21020 RepID=UPI003F651CB6
MQVRFGTTAYDDPMEMLTKWGQTSSVAMYKAQFEVLSNRIKGLSPTHKLSCFLGGLKDEIRLPVRMLNPQSLNEAFGLSKIEEEYNWSCKKSSKVQMEQGIRIAKLEEGGENSVVDCSLNGQEGSVEEAGITLYALSGTPTSGTMRLHIPVDTSQVLEVKLANGDVLRTQGLCEAVSLCVQRHQFLVQLYVLPMGGCDLVLGTQWLSTLGVIQWDFKLQTMCFSYGQNFVLLHGLREASSHI